METVTLETLTSQNEVNTAYFTNLLTETQSKAKRDRRARAQFETEIARQAILIEGLDALSRCAKDWLAKSSSVARHASECRIKRSPFPRGKGTATLFKLLKSAPTPMTVRELVEAALDVAGVVAAPQEQVAAMVASYRASLKQAVKCGTLERSLNRPYRYSVAKKVSP